MKSFAIVLALAIVAIANASDLDSAEWMLKCTKYAITNGCAEANIPMYTPFRFNKTFERSFQYNIVGIKVEVLNITWAGFPEWQLKNVSQISEDSDATAKFNYHLYWPKFDINADYEATVTEAIIHQVIKGKLKLVMDDVNWTGVLSFIKPTTSSAASFPEIDLTWHVEEVKADVTGAGPVGNTIATAVRLGLTGIFKTQVAKWNIQDFILNILNTSWAQDGDRVNKMITFCKNAGL